MGMLVPGCLLARPEAVVADEATGEVDVAVDEDIVAGETLPKGTLRLETRQLPMRARGTM